MQPTRIASARVSVAMPIQGSGAPARNSAPRQHKISRQSAASSATERAGGTRPSSASASSGNSR